MSTTTLPDTGLDRLTLTDRDPRDASQYANSGCPAEALFEGIYSPDPGCAHTRRLYCLTHRDLIVAKAAKATRFFCPVCGPGRFSVLLRMEAL